jgi:ABC-type Fe3+/spermidine/putrescine transport system ATPase subunit
VAEGPDIVAAAGLRLRVASADLKPGAAVALSIRPHEIVVTGPEATADAAGSNAFRGAVQRASYLGDAVDYEVKVDGGDVVLRVSAPPTLRLRPGEHVGLRVAPVACVPLTDGD